MSIKKRICFLLAALFVCIAGIAALLLYQPGGAPDPLAEPTRFVSYGDVDDLVLAQLQNASGTVTLLHAQGSYLIDGEEPGLADQDAISAFFASLRVLQSTSTAKTDVPEDKRGDYGLDEPQATLLVGDKEQNGIQVQIGGQAPGQQGYYFSVAGLPDVFLMSGQDAARFLRDVNSFYKLEFYPSMTGESIKQLQAVRLSAPGGGYELRQTGASEATNLVYFDMTAPIKVTPSRENVEAVLLTPLQSLRGTALAAREPGSLADYGLEQPEYILELRYLGRDYRLLFHKQADGTFYGMTEGRGMVFTVDASRLGFLDSTYLDVVGQNVLERNITTISSIELQIGGQPPRRFEVSGAGDSLQASENGSPLPMGPFLSLFNGLGSIRIEGAQESAPEAEPLLRIQLTYRDESTPTETVELLPLDDRKCAVKVNGATVFWTYRTTVDTLDGLLSAVTAS